MGYLNSEQQFQLCDGGEPSADNVRQQPPFRRGTAGGIDHQFEIRNYLNCRGFLPDFGSVPDSMFNQ